VPIILQTGIGLPPALAAGFGGLVVHIKPCVPARLIEELARIAGANRRAEWPRTAVRHDSGRPRCGRLERGSACADRRFRFPAIDRPRPSGGEISAILK
jgi:hypothetical protein